MKKVITFSCLGLFLSCFGGCGPHKAITVNTGWGQEVIPGYCSAWTDGCNIGCRLQGTEYTNLKTKENCKNEDIHRAQCVDDEPEKLKACDKVR